MIRRSLLVFLALCLSLMLFSPALAGGWAVISLNAAGRDRRRSAADDRFQGAPARQDSAERTGSGDTPE